MITKVLTISELKEIFLENLLNKTSKVSKIADNSVLSGIGYGVAKIGQKAVKDIALVESHLFIDSAFGDNLDLIAVRSGISTRLGSSGSSTYIRLVGDEGTVYLQGIHNFTGSHGIVFELDEDVVIGEHGFVYTRVRSTVTGLQTNVDALSINTINSTPFGHSYVVNEVGAQGGRDVEDDLEFKRRIKQGINLCARNTIGYLEQVFIRINERVLRVFYLGVGDDGKNILSIVTQNGIGLTSAELYELLDKSKEYLALSDLNQYGRNVIGISLINNEWEYIDMDFRCQLETGVDSEEVRKNIQIRICKYLDWRFWDYNKRVEWDDLLTIVKSTNGVKAVSDNTFYPNTDIVIDYTKLPRLRGFIMRDLEGSIIQDVSGVIVPSFFPNEEDIEYSRTILANL